MVVLYYTTTYFLDVAIETIQAIKDKVDLYVVIEISPNSKNSTIINVEDLNSFKDLEDCENVLGKAEWSYLKKYFNGVVSTRFLVHKHRKNFAY